jgi:predicted nucleic acid-binding protein
VRFLDTNILLYRISTDPAEREKRMIAAKLLKERDLHLSVQVLQEFYVQATRSTRKDRIAHEEAVALIESWKRFPVQPITLDVLDAALRAKDRWQLSYWDAAIIEAARCAGCDTIFSEDLSDGQSYDGIRVLNPFC